MSKYLYLGWAGNAIIPKISSLDIRYLLMEDNMGLVYNYSLDLLFTIADCMKVVSSSKTHMYETVIRNFSMMEPKLGMAVDLNKKFSVNGKIVTAKEFCDIMAAAVEFPEGGYYDINSLKYTTKEKFFNLEEQYFLLSVSINKENGASYTTFHVKQIANLTWKNINTPQFYYLDGNFYYKDLLTGNAYPIDIYEDDNWTTAVDINSDIQYKRHYYGKTKETE